MQKLKKNIVIGKSIFRIFSFLCSKISESFLESCSIVEAASFFPQLLANTTPRQLNICCSHKANWIPVCLRHNSSLSGSREIQHALFRQCCQVLLSSFVCSWLSCRGMQIISFGAAPLYSHTPSASDVLKGSSSCICVVCVEAQSVVIKHSSQRP